MDQVCLPSSLQQGISLHSSFNVTPMKDADNLFFFPRMSAQGANVYIVQ